MRNLLVLLLLSFLPGNLPGNDGYVRNIHANVLNYKFSLAINDSTDRIEGKASICVLFSKRTDSIYFDLKGTKSDGKGMTVEYVSANSIDVKWVHHNDKLLIVFDNATAENDTVDFVIDYNGTPADGLIISKNKFGSRTFFADHWPDRAHNYLPCIDHPYDKAAVDFIITAPDRYKVVANGLLIGEAHVEDNLTLTHWSESVPVATKVMAFGAADFAVQRTGTVNDIPVSAWVFPENREQGFADYSVAVKPIDYYSSLVGTYPYKKLANVQSKTIYGGLENAGTIFYAENSVTGMGRAERLIAHEIAHQWFGNCVTEADWHHIWLSEGFATYLTSVYFESFQGKAGLKTDMELSRKRVLNYFNNDPKPVIDTSVTNLTELLNANSYQKGAWVLHMLRHEIGDEAFFAGLRLFFERFHNSNVLTDDFKNIMAEVSGRDLDKFFHQWLYVAGQPELKIWSKVNKRKGNTEVFVEQRQEILFEFTIDLLIADKTGEKLVSVSTDKRITSVIVPTTSAYKVIPDPGVNLLFR